MKKIIQGNNIDTLKQYPDNHFDSIVTDPPYGIEFLGKDWDSNTGAVETWEQCFRVLKPGGYILAFSAARTYHNLATNIEGVGFEIRDQIMWLYASGFPKAQDIGKAIQKRQGIEKSKPSKGMNAYPEAQQWAGWKTALKPAHEPIVMARKPYKGSTIDNVLTHGVGALNIDATRIDYECDYDAKHQADISRGQENATNGTNFFGSSKSVSDDKGQGRFPSNVLGEVEGYQKFFYCPKVNRKERHIGKIGNNHPTVKPVALMKYLVKLVTPEGGKVLDPFTGSGSTGMAAVELGYDFTGCELDPDYVNIATKRITAWQEHTKPTTNIDDLMEK